MVSSVLTESLKSLGLVVVFSGSVLYEGCFDIIVPDVEGLDFIGRH